MASLVRKYANKTDQSGGTIDTKENTSPPDLKFSQNLAKDVLGDHWQEMGGCLAKEIVEAKSQEVAASLARAMLEVKHHLQSSKYDRTSL